MIRSLCALAMLVSQIGQAAPPQEGARPRAKDSPLAGLPGKPGPHIEKLEALGQNAWLNLGAPAADPTWGRARGRAWTPIMACAPDLGGAFLWGEGVHGYVKPDGRYMDDLWFYDARGHRWICCDPGTDMSRLDAYKRTENGWIAAPDGQVRPHATTVHGYNLPCYSPQLRRFIALGGTSYATKAIGRMRDRLLPTRAQRNRWFDRRDPFFWNVTTGRWERQDAEGGPNGIEIYGTSIVWLPTIHKFLMLSNRGTWLYDPKTRTWAQPKPENDPGPIGEGLHCYDSKRHRLYRFSRPKDKGEPGWFGIYDVASNKWILPKAAFHPDTVGGTYYTNTAYAHYDAAADKAIVFLSGGEKPGAYVYDPVTDQWQGEPVTAGAKKGRSAYYDATLNVHLFFDAGDSRDTPGVIWAWRYKRAAKQD